LLAACVAAIALSSRGQPAELIIVDDGSRQPIRSPSLGGGREATVLRLEGGGPAAARNAGIRAARGDVILFTDDDTLPDPSWVESALRYLDAEPAAVGVTGPIRSVPWDPLYEKSIQSRSAQAAAGGHYWTCNIAYRRAVLERLHGFRDDLFAHAHAEDRDLAGRAQELGSIGFAPGMAVSHTPRPFAVRDVARRAAWARDDIVLYALHPEFSANFTLPVRLALVLDAGRKWLRYARRGDLRSSLVRLPRALVLSTVDVTATALALLRTPPMRVLRERHESRAA
jgi:glycosyltransferase involved in cell wall biosynthesis